MNFDTRTVLDIILLDPSLEIILTALVDAEKVIWVKSGKTSQNEFVRSVIPIVKDELHFYMKNRIYRVMKMGFIKKLVDLDKVDYYQLIPAVAKI
jgi:hypothetical protein